MVASFHCIPYGCPGRHEQVVVKLVAKVARFTTLLGNPLLRTFALLLLIRTLLVAVLALFVLADDGRRHDDGRHDDGCGRRGRHDDGCGRRGRG